MFFFNNPIVKHGFTLVKRGFTLYDWRMIIWKFKKLMEGQSPTAIAKEIGVTRQTIHSWMEGEYPALDRARLDAICKAFGCNIQDLIEYHEGE